MRFYAMNYREVLALPLHTFWMLNRNVSRIQAEEDLRAFRLLVAAQHGEGAAETFRDLQTEIGTPVVTVARMQTGAIQRLKQLAGAGNERR